jgi:hypothetical protein
VLAAGRNKIDELADLSCAAREKITICYRCGRTKRFADRALLLQDFVDFGVGEI